MTSAGDGEDEIFIKGFSLHICSLFGPKNQSLFRTIVFSKINATCFFSVFVSINGSLMLYKENTTQRYSAMLPAGFQCWLFYNTIVNEIVF